MSYDIFTKLYILKSLFLGHTPRKRFEHWLGRRNTLLSIFSKINRYSAKRGKSWFVSHFGLCKFRTWAKLIIELLPPNVWPLVTSALLGHLNSALKFSWINCSTKNSHPVKDGVSDMLGVSLSLFGIYETHVHRIFHNYSTSLHWLPGDK